LQLLPTMVVAGRINGRVLETYEYLAALCITCGMVLFAAADFKVFPNANYYGIMLVLISITADAFLPNLQVHTGHGAGEIFDLI
jgi:hypothetical protein